MENLNGRDSLGNEVINGRILLKWALKKEGVNSNHLT
jgi:hypothetical protein